MTCIAGLVCEGKVYIGGDSAGVSGLDLDIRKDQKVFKNDDYIFGFTSSFRMGQLLRYAFKPPKFRPAEDDLDTFMVTKFINSVRTCLKDGGYARTKSDEEEGGTFLVGTQGRLFIVHNDYQVGESVHGYEACGCGEAYAKSALWTMKQLDSHLAGGPQAMVELALQSAETHSGGVRGPFSVVSI
jgi:ATP-dependent protease HslVU (ClpYQ) peptidase subunit